jgi:hypothetical protein
MAGRRSAIAVTNVCNATTISATSPTTGPRHHRAYMDVGDYGKALDILYRRERAHLAFQGGEPFSIRRSSR